MPCSTLLRLKRELVSVLLSLVSAYGVATDVNRDSEDDAILVAYRRVVKKVHPDKGGTKDRFQSIMLAYETWSDPSCHKRYDQRLARLDKQNSDE